MVEIGLVNEVKNYKIDILGITETKKKGQGTDNLGSHTLVFSGVNRNERARAGVALLLKNNLYELCDFNYINERLIEANIEFRSKNIKLIVGYGPNKDASKDEKEDFYDQLQIATDNTKRNQEIIILGDLNARVGNKYDKCFGAIGKEGENIESANGKCYKISASEITLK